MQSARSNTDDTKSKSSVHESLVQEAPLVSGHSAVLTGLTVENDVGGQNGTTDDGSTIQQLLSDVATLGTVRLLGVGPAEGILESLTRLSEDRGRCAERLGCLRGLERRVVDEASSVGELGHLSECRRHSERTSQEESHGDDAVK